MNQHCLIKAALADQVKGDIIRHGPDAVSYYECSQPEENGSRVHAAGLLSLKIHYRGSVGRPGESNLKTVRSPRTLAASVSIMKKMQGRAVTLEPSACLGVKL